MKYRNDLKKRVLAGLFAGAALCLAAPAALAANSPVANDTFPSTGNFVAGNGTIHDPMNGQMTIEQSTPSGIINWSGGFNVGANATVNFKGPQDFNTLNYDPTGNMSQIYGTINAQGGNIYIVNPSGVEIGNSAQINVGSLYVSNKKLDNELENIENKDNPNIGTIMSHGTIGDAVLMSLGNVNANKVTFDGDRIVIDTERLKDTEGNEKLKAENIIIRTNNASNVVIGYDAYNEGDNKGTYKGKNKDATAFAQIWANGNKVEEGSLNAYMWVEDVEQLQAINTNLSGNYALRNSIDATATQDWNDTGTSTDVKEGFQSIGALGNEFTGKFDGLDYNIFNLNIKKDTDNVGLFGVVGEGAVINNVTLVGGSITGQNNVGALAGSVQGGAHISNITNSASVTGEKNVGGIVGESIGNDSQKTVYENLINTGTITSSGTEDGESGRISNAGGLIGYLEKGDLGGTSYNLGAVTGRTENDGSMIVGYNVGGLVGHAVNSVIGNEDMIDEGGNVIAEGTTVYNRLNVTGAYNVGGIVGNMESTQVYNAENSGNVSATRYKTGDYFYHSAHYKESNEKDIVKQENVNIANAGGIAGSASGSSMITDVLNTGDVSSGTGMEQDYTYYTAGNVGGIAGSAVDTNITNATNRENEIRGAHNVGGIAGYFGGSGIVSKGINDGGDVLATGARGEKGFVTEIVRGGNTGGELTNIGNMGGVVGYLQGDEAYITDSANRGTVHSETISDPNYVLPISEAANAGGVVGKVDRNTSVWLDGIKKDPQQAAVSNSYNTGDVRGYLGVGGVAGMMYNGSISGSYNLGNVNTTRRPGKNATSYYTVNIGGIVGDTTEGTGSWSVLYDVYNKGQIGDDTFTYYARHVGGIVGRLSGEVDKAYNTGAIYNGYNVTGGIAGWFYKGTISNSFNAGDITVVSKENTKAGSQVGGIAGAAEALNQVTFSNVYNLGTIRSFQENGESRNFIGGIIGKIINNDSGKITVENAYTMGNLYAQDADGKSTRTGLGSVYGGYDSGGSAAIDLTNVYYIKPENTGVFQDLSHTNADVTSIEYANRSDPNQYRGFGIYNPIQEDPTNAGVDDKNYGWRIYDGTTLILNAFLPDAETYFEKNGLIDSNKKGGFTVQYGTAYDPLLTIIKADTDAGNLSFDWGELNVSDDAGLAVYGAGLDLTSFGTNGYFSGILYSDGALSIAGADDILLGSASNLYGSSVSVNTEGDITSYGNIYATAADEKDENKGDVTIKGGEVNLYGKINFSKGQETSIPGIAAQEGASTIIAEEVSNPHFTMQTVGDRYAHKLNGSTSGDALAGDVTITAKDDVNLYYGQEKDGLITANDLTVTTENGNIYSDSDLAVEGNITFTAPGEKVLDLTNIGKVRGEEFMDAIGKALQSIGVDMNNPDSVRGNKDNVKTKLTDIVKKFSDPEHNTPYVYVDEIYASLTNGTITSGGDSYERNMAWLEENVPLNLLHDFLHNFDKRNTEDPNSIRFTGSSDGKITIDMWDYEANTFNLKKYDQDLSRGESHTLSSELTYMNINVEEESGDEKPVAAQDYVYIWVSDGDQLKGIQQYYQQETDAGRKTDILSYNFALKNDINASGVTDYEAIGTNSQNGYTGIFDGRDNRIIGLDTTKKSDGITQTLTNAGIFDTIGAGGTVEDLRVYSGTFTGKDNAGAVAGVNKGNISNVTAFGNVVTAQGSTASTELGNLTEEGSVHVGAAGGIAGVNYGTIDNASAVGTATAADAEDGNDALSTAGGIVGINMGDTAKISNSSSNSAVNASAESTYALGGAAGVNSGTLENVDSLGVTTGIYKVQTGGILYAEYSDNVGGIAGTNSGSISNAYNESIVSGRDNVGGIIGTNEAGTIVENVSNAASVTGEAGTNDTSDYVGGLAGTNSGTITNGRNNGTITGNQYVGGLVGNNASADSKLENLVNDEAAAITGDNFVGGIAGSNAGTITAIDQQLVNRGSITGQTYVGGVAGVNTETGVIANTISSIALHVKTPYSDDSDDSNDPKYFGGVVGQNQGTIQGATNESSVDVAADGASMVGGIIGENTETGKLEGTIANKGVVSGKSDVGGIIGSNKNDDILNNSAGADRLIVSNSGLVKAEDGGAAGIFYKNTGAINNADLVNTGMVIGGSSKDSVTGGLIGVNTGDITGGRDENDGYYKYQIYNNGTITAGTWTDTNGDGMIDEGEITAGAAGNDIAGLFGSNSGKVTAAYNTGAVVAENSTNVGGIAGTNSGTLDQVFNTVMTGVNENGETQYGSITGNSNVGGLVGSNTGTISNAYNTSAVEGTTSGSLVGTNNGTVSNVYGSGADKLIGDGTEAVTVYDAEKDSFGENGSSIDMVGGQSAVWRQYGENNPILKIFLTTVTYDPTKNDQNLVYNGQDQTLDVTGSGFSAADKFETHNSVTGGLIYHDVDGAHKNAGNYTDYLWSEQIKAGGEGDTFNPNHLGYDVQSVDYTIDQKELTIDLGDVTHEYGSPNLGQYEGNFTVSGWVEGEDFSGDISLSDIKDEGLKDDTHTKDVGGYTWSANATINGTFGQGGAGNYKITAKPNAGKSTVTQKTITVNLNDVVHTYGDNQDESKYGIRDTIKWANDDTYTNGDVVLSGISDEAFDGTTGHTNNAGGDYSWTADVSGTGSDADRINQNYKFEVVKGDSDIEKKGITIELGDVSHVYGTPTKDGYTFTANGWVYDEDFSKDVNIGSLGDGITDNALKDNNHHTQDVNQDGYTWTTDKAGISGDGATNYYVESIVDGKSAVTPVTIDVELGDISHEYGTPNDDYGLKNDIVWANGDTYTNEDIILGNIQDEALKDGTPTKGVGDYIWEASVSGTGSDAERIKGNYVFNVKQGASKVTPKDLHIIVDDKDIYVGEPVPEYTGHMDDLVNGDTMTDAPVYSTDPAEEVNTAQTGSYDIGVQFGNNYISSGDGYDWTKVWDGFKNYNVIFEPGKLTISDMPVDRPSEGEHWNFLFDDNPWDRNRDFRERKAEVHFVAGGMTL